MAEYTATVTWQRGDAAFTDNRYNRAHRWAFDGGAQIGASSSPHAVRPPFSDPACVDPEEAFVAAISSCHMLSFLYLAAKQGFTIDSYTDEAVGTMEEIAEGRQAITKVTLRPQITLIGSLLPTEEEIEELHHRAHEICYIANSVKTEIVVEKV